MTDQVVPHFHNDLGVQVIEIGAKKSPVVALRYAALARRSTALIRMIDADLLTRDEAGASLLISRSYWCSLGRKTNGAVVMAAASLLRRFSDPRAIERLLL
jgi:hypothetical protein